MFSRKRAHMHIRTIMKFVSLLAFVCASDVSHSADTLTLPVLQDGEALLCEPYPYRIVTNTSRTVYQIARLGFMSVRSFQQTHDLKADGIIGPLTQRRVEAEYQRRFGQAATASRAIISVSVQPVATTTGITAMITVRSMAATPVRIVGSLRLRRDYDQRSGLLCQRINSGRWRAGHAASFVGWLGIYPTRQRKRGLDTTKPCSITCRVINCCQSRPGSGCFRTLWSKVAAGSSFVYANR